MSNTTSEQRRLRVIFFGTPEIAIPTLQALHANHNLIAVVSQADRPVGRKKILTSPPIVQHARELGVPVILQPEKIKGDTEEARVFEKELRALDADLFVVFAYGKILSHELLEIPRHGAVNIHPSLLPELRGPSPIQSAILRGFTMTGISFMIMNDQMDAGDILETVKIPLSDSITTPELENIVAEKSGQLIPGVLTRYVQGDTQPNPQDDAAATFCSLLRRDDGEIGPGLSAQEIDRKFRGLHPWPGIYVLVQGVRIKILACAYDRVSETIIVERVQREGSSPQQYAEFLRQSPDLRLSKPFT